MNLPILLIDDEPDMLVLLDRILRTKTEYEVEQTNNPLQLPKLLKKQPYDLIITDLSMPRMDGLDVVRLIQQQKRSELVVLITAFGDFDSSRAARELGVFDYIHKPFRKERILETVERAMSTQRKRRLSTANSSSVR